MGIDRAQSIQPADKPAAVSASARKTASVRPGPVCTPNRTEALIIEAASEMRLRTLRCGNHYLQTYDYVTARRHAIASRPPGTRREFSHGDRPPRPGGTELAGYGRPDRRMIFWRFFLPEEPIAPFKTRSYGCRT